MQNTFITVYKNDYKKEPKHPDFKAYASIGGKLEQVGAGWTKEKNGKKYISFSFQTVPLSQAMNDTGLAPQASIMPAMETLPPKVYQSTLTPEQTKEIVDARNAEIEARKANEELDATNSITNADFENF